MSGICRSSTWSLTSQKRHRSSCVRLPPSLTRVRYNMYWVGWVCIQCFFSVRKCGLNASKCLYAFLPRAGSSCYSLSVDMSSVLLKNLPGVCVLCLIDCWHWILLISVFVFRLVSGLIIGVQVLKAELRRLPTSSLDNSWTLSIRNHRRPFIMLLVWVQHIFFW